jgi:hypothetical protein
LRRGQRCGEEGESEIVILSLSKKDNFSGRLVFHACHLGMCVVKDVTQQPSHQAEAWRAAA